MKGVGPVTVVEEIGNKYEILIRNLREMQVGRPMRNWEKSIVVALKNLCSME
jgi:hypothetical protein